MSVRRKRLPARVVRLSAIEPSRTAEASARTVYVDGKIAGALLPVRAFLTAADAAWIVMYLREQLDVNPVLTALVDRALGCAA